MSGNENKQGNDKKEKKGLPWGVIIPAICVLIGTIVTAYFTYLGIVAPIAMELESTKEAAQFTAAPTAKVASPTAIPPRTTEVSPATTEAPPATTEAPPATTEAPPATTEAPPATTEAPPATTEVPPATTEVPPVPTEPFEKTGQVAKYRFEGNVNDLGDDNHYGKLTGTAQFTTGCNGQANSAIQFDGNGYVQLADEDAFDLPTFTINLVLRLGELGPEDDWIFSKGTKFGNFTIRRAGNSHPWPGYGTYVHQTSRGNWSSLTSSAPLPVDRFFCLAVSVSETTFKAYIDGQLVRTVQNVSPPQLNDSPVIIGAGGYYDISEYFSGVIDEVQIFREALTDAEVADLCPLCASSGR